MGEDLINPSNGSKNPIVSEFIHGPIQVTTSNSPPPETNDNTALSKIFPYGDVITVTSIALLFFKSDTTPFGPPIALYKVGCINNVTLSSATRFCLKNVKKIMARKNVVHLKNLLFKSILLLSLYYLFLKSNI